MPTEQRPDEQPSMALPVVRRAHKEHTAGSSGNPRAPKSLLWVGVLCLAGGLVAVSVSWVIGRPQGAPGESEELVATTDPSPATPVLSARRAPGFTTAMIPRRAMAAAVQPVADAAPPDTCIGVGIGTETLYLHNGAAPLVPASNQKILTASAALDLLGPDETLKTTFAADSPITNGVVAGDLFMIGNGDPVLTTDAYQARQQHGRFPETDLEAAADRLVSAGIRRITGAVVGDAGRYDAQRMLPDWKQRWQSGGTVAPLSALLVNDGWLTDPVTGEGSGGPAPDPAQHAAAVMARLLSDRGVVIGGAARSGVAPADPHAIAEVESPPISTLVEQLLSFSDNTTAELLLKELGVRSGATGSTADGVAAVVEWARDEGIAEDHWVMVDGSGLSSGNLLTCTMLAALLRRAGPDSVLAEGLAVPGGAGTLEDRFTSGELSDRLRAKTGTLNEVSALSGWFTGAADAMLDFEFVLNTRDRAVGVDDLVLQQELLDALADQPVPPPLLAAGPQPVTDG